MAAATMASSDAHESNAAELRMTMGSVNSTSSLQPTKNSKSRSFQAPEEDFIAAQTEDGQEFTQIYGSPLSSVEDLDCFPLMIIPDYLGLWTHHCFMEKDEFDVCSHTEQSLKFEEYYRSNRLRRFFEERGFLYQLVACCQIVFVGLNLIGMLGEFSGQAKSTTHLEGPGHLLNDSDRLRMSISVWNMTWRSTNKTSEFVCDVSQGDHCMAMAEASDPWFCYCVLNFVLMQLAYVTAPPNWQKPRYFMTKSLREICGQRGLKEEQWQASLLAESTIFISIKYLKEHY